MAEARPAGGRPRRSPCGADECVRQCGYLTREGKLCLPATTYRGPLTEEEARAKIADHRAKPRQQPKPKGNPEAQVGFAIDQRMAEAGFRVFDLSKHRKSGGVWVSAVTAGLTDRYYAHPDGRAIFVELKAPGGRLRPAQVTFQELHRHNPIEVVCWSSVEECETWLAAFA